MRSRAVLLMLIVALATWQPQLHLASADAATIEITLYAHTDPSAVSVQGRVLSLIGNTTSQHSGDVRDGLDFTLVPVLSAPLHLLGGIDVYVWLRSQNSVRGELRVAISEVRANGTSSVIRSASVNIVVPAVSLSYHIRPWASGLQSLIRLDPRVGNPIPAKCGIASIAALG